MDPRPAATARVSLLMAILKAQGAPEAIDMAIGEVRLRIALMDAHFEAAKAAVDAAVKVVSRTSRPTTHTVARVIQATKDVYQQAFLPAAKAATDAAIPGFYRAGKIEGWRKATGAKQGKIVAEPSVAAEALGKATPKGTAFAMIKPAFDVKDQEAIAAMQAHQVFWIGDHYDENLSETIGITAKWTLLEDGLSSAAAAPKLEKALKDNFGLTAPESWKGTTPAYMKMVSANAATTGRVYGSTRAFQQFGVSRLVIWNPIDEVTCERCGLMDGKTIPIEAASKQMADVLGSKTKAGVKAAHPWQSAKKWKGLGMSKGPGKIGGGLGGKLAALGICLPPYHGECRCTVDIADDATLAPIPHQPDWTEPPSIEVPAPEPIVPEVPVAEPEPAPPIVPEPAPIPEPPAPAPIPEPIPAPPVVVAEPTPPVPAEVQIAPVKPKKPKVPKAPKEPVPAPASPASAIPNPPAAETLPPHRQAFPWRQEELKARPDIKLKGAHQKYVYESPDGQLWMFKPVHAGEEFLAHAEKAASDLALDLNVPSVEIHVVKIGNKTGSIHRMFPNVDGDYRNVALTTVQPDDFDQLLSNHVLNWLTGDNDPHVENFLRLKDGRIIGIDHGQVFKFYDTDDLFDLNYNPNSAYHDGTVVNKLLKAYSQGEFGARELPMDLANLPRTRALIDAIEATPNEQLLKYTSAWADGAHKRGLGPFSRGWDRRAFDTNFLYRKDGLRDEFESLLGQVKLARNKLVQAPAKPGSITPLNAEWMAKVRTAKGGGRSLFIGGADFEDMHLVASPTKNDGIFLRGKIRKDAGDKFQAALDKILGVKSPVASPGATAAAGASPTDSPLYQKTLTVVKSFKAHLTPGHAVYDGAVPGKTWAAAQTIADDCAEIMKKFPAGSPEYLEASHYKAAIDTFATTDSTGVITGWKTNDVGGVFVKPWQPPKPKAVRVPKPKPAPSEPAAGFTVRRIDWGEAKKVYQDGEIVVDAQRGFEVWKPGSANAYEIDAGNGVKIRYRRHEPTGHTEYAEQGMIEIHVDRAAVGSVTERDIEQTLARLGDLGLETRLADQTDLDLMYLRKVAHVSGLEDTAEFKKISTTDSPAEQVKALKAFWQKKVPGFEKSAAWKNRLVWDNEEFDGHPHWLRFDIADEIAEADSKGYHLGHAIGYCQGISQTEKIDRIVAMIKGTRGLSATEERLRLGIQGPRSITDIGGSASTDRGTGGASYVFTRVRRGGYTGDDLEFSIHLARDANGVSYNGDMFGNVTPETYRSRRNKTATGILDTAAVGNNETNVKGRIGFAQWLKTVRVKSQAEKKRILNAFKEVGITHCGGTPVDKVVVIRGG